MPSALIPFCSLLLFDPVVHEGKLCYQMDMAEKMPKEKIVQGDGLTLLMDANL